MSNATFMNMIRQQANIVNSSRTLTSIGVVTAYDPSNYLVIVQLYPQDEDTPALQTGWIPLFSPWVGSGWGLFFPPNIGDIIEVHYQDGSLQNAYAGLRAYTFDNRPLSVPSGEFWLVHNTGSAIKLTNDGVILLNSTAEIDVGNIANPFLALLNSVAFSVFNGHTHSTPSGESLAPTQQMSSTSLTTVLKGN